LEIPSERWLTLQEAAAHLNVSRSWLYQKGKAAGVPRTQIGNKYRYRATELDAWIQAQGSE
jgi:excisionase family DNA binding protein